MGCAQWFHPKCINICEVDDVKLNLMEIYCLNCPKKPIKKEEIDLVEPVKEEHTNSIEVESSKPLFDSNEKNFEFLGKRELHPHIQNSRSKFSHANEKRPFPNIVKSKRMEMNIALEVKGDLNKSQQMSIKSFFQDSISSSYKKIKKEE